MRLENLFAVNGHVARRIDADAYLIAFHNEHGSPSRRYRS
jgi:hypothetical protein